MGAPGWTRRGASDINLDNIFSSFFGGGSAFVARVTSLIKHSAGGGGSFSFGGGGGGADDDAFNNMFRGGFAPGGRQAKPGPHGRGESD